MNISYLTKSSTSEISHNDFDNVHLDYFSIKSIHDQLNQDGLVVISEKNTLKCILVIDGMGGHQGGEKATQIVVDTCNEFLEKFNNSDLRLVILDVLEQSDLRIKSLKIGAGATVTAIELGQDFVRFYNAGDAFGLLIGARGKFKFKTIEHSPLGFGIEAGIVDRNNDLVESHTVLNGLGFEPMRIEISQKMEVKNNDLVLLSSDGILNNFTIDDLISEMVEGDFNSRLERLKNKIVQASDKYLKDDTTIAYFKIKS